MKKKRCMAVLLSAMMAAQSMTCYAAGAGDDIAVTSAQSLGIIAFASASTVQQGDTVQIAASASGGSGTYTYSYLIYNKDTNSWYRLTPSFGKSNIYTWKAGSKGNRIFYAEVKDSSGKVVRSSGVNVKVNGTTPAAKELTITAKSSADSVTVGNKVTITAQASGGKGGYTYSYLVHNKDTNQWSRLTSAFTSSNTYTWKAGSQGNREFFAEVKDSTGKVVRSKAVTISAKKAAPVLTVFAGASTYQTNTGNNVTIFGNASGGTGNYTYSYLVHNKDTNQWSRLTSSFIKNSTYTWKAGSAGNRDFFVEVKDSSGKVVRSSAVNIKTMEALKPLQSILQLSKDTAETGDTILLSVTAAGGQEPYTYSYLSHNKDTDQWTRLTASFTNNNSYSWTAENTGNMEFFAEVKDNTGKVARSSAKAVTINKKNIAVSSVSISGQKKIFMDAASSAQTGLKAVVAPADATNQAVTWSSNNTGVATVDQAGNVKAAAEGTAVITVKTEDGAKTDSVTVYVYRSGVQLPSDWKNKNVLFAAASNTNLNMDVVNATSAAGTKVQYFGSNDSSAQHWRVSEDGSKGLILKPESSSTGDYILSANRGGTSNALKSGQSIELAANGSDNTASRWELVHTWDGYYIIKLRGYNYAIGAAEVTQSTKLQLKDFNVSDNAQKWKTSAKNIVGVTGVKITSNKNNVVVKSGNSIQTNWSVTPSNAANKNVTWSSSNNSVATVDSSGKVTAKAAGTAEITVKTNDGGKTDKYTVYVYQENVGLPSGEYLIVSKKSSGLALDYANGNRANATNVGAYGIHNGDNQIWRFDNYNSKYGGWAIVTKGGEFVLDVYRPTNGNMNIDYNDNIDIYQLDDPDAQIWIADKFWDGSYAFHLKSMNGAITLCDSGNVNFQQYNINNINQRWTLQNPGTKPDPSPKPTGYKEKIDNLKTQSPYRTGDTWNGQFSNAWQCHGWALMVGNALSGTDPRNWQQVNTLNGVKSGDIIRYGGDNGHTIVVYDVSGDTITYGDCNGSGGTNKVKWGSTISKSGMKIFGYSFNYRLVAP